MKRIVADYIADCVAREGVKDVFVFSGGANLPCLDAIARNPRLEFIATHHEQSAAMAAEAYSRVTRNLGVVLVTTGPGGTNAFTGVLGAWQDSIPLLVISGQVRSDRLEKPGLRQFSIQGFDVVAAVKTFTKYATTITRADQVKPEFEKAIAIARSGRPGPVWLDVPLDIQGAPITFDETPTPAADKASPPAFGRAALDQNIKRALEMLREAQRPVILIGTGVALAGAEAETRALLELLRAPFLCSWNIQTLVSHQHPLYFGSPGTFGTRSANFVVQNCDFLLTIGSRLSIAQTGHNYKAFARAARKVVVDIDANELAKGTIVPDIAIQCDAKVFVEQAAAHVRASGTSFGGRFTAWTKQCASWKERYSAVLPEYRQQVGSINSYVFIETLSEELLPTDVIVLGVGTSFTCTFQSFRAKQGQRLFHSGGTAAMGYCLPGAVGACIANDRRRTICITGDGCIQLNLQELQTIVHHRLPVKIFMFNNNGYLTMRATQDQWFDGRYAATSPEGGISFPDMQKVAAAYGIPAVRLTEQEGLAERIRTVLESDGPAFCEIMMDPKQPLIPYLSYCERPDGSRYAAPLEDLFPFLDREVFRQEMLIPAWEEPGAILKPLPA